MRNDDACGHGQIFELIVMNRFSLNVNLLWRASFFVFGQIQSHCNRCNVCNPKLFNFPEINMIWKSGQTECDVQVCSYIKITQFVGKIYTSV